MFCTENRGKLRLYDIYVFYLLHLHINAFRRRKVLSLSSSNAHFGYFPIGADYICK